MSSWKISAEELKKWGEEVLKPKAAFCKAKNQCRARAEEMLRLAQLEFKKAPLLTDDEIAEVLSKADELAKWAADVYSYAQDEAINNGRIWNGYKLVRGKTNRKYTDEDDVIKAANEAGYNDVFKKSLIGITEMEKLMGKKKFNDILGGLVYKPDGKLTLVPESDKREAVSISTAADEFQKK